MVGIYVAKSSSHSIIVHCTEAKKHRGSSAKVTEAIQCQVVALIRCVVGGSVDIQGEYFALSVYLFIYLSIIVIYRFIYCDTKLNF